MTKPLYKPKTPSPLTRSITAKELEKTIVKNTSYNLGSNQPKINAGVQAQDVVKVSDRNEYKKMLIDFLVEKFRAEQEQKEAARQEQQEAARQLAKAALNNRQELSGETYKNESPLHCNESLDDPLDDPLDDFL